jgi:hypothetical protein
MSVPQDSRLRRIQKRRRTKKLARWREQHAATQQPATDEKAPKKAGSE